MEVGLARGAYQFEFDRMTDGVPARDGGKHLRELVPAVLSHEEKRQSLELFIKEVIPAFQ